MCNSACLKFGKSHLSREEVEGASIIEVGAQDVNGSFRAIVKTLNPMRYLGVDIVPGPGVDEICDINNLVARYGKESFDVVISTEILEHVRDWRRAVSNLKGILRTNGILLLTTRSRGFPYHAHPFDFWRYEVDDMRMLFPEFSIEANERDSEAPGVFIKVRKPAIFIEKDLRNYMLYSMVRGKRCRDIREIDIILFRSKRTVLRVLTRVLPAGIKANIKNWMIERKRILG